MIKIPPEFYGFAIAKWEATAEQVKLKGERVSVRHRILKIEQWLNEYKPKKNPEIPRVSRNANQRKRRNSGFEEYNRKAVGGLSESRELLTSQ